MSAPQNGTAATGEIVTFSKKVASFRDLLDSMKQQLAVALPKHVKVERLIRICLTTVQRTPALLECTQSSVIGSILQAAQLGLEPDGILGEAYLIPYNEKYKDGNVERWRKVCQLIPGYKGLMKLARNSGQISTVYARVVHEKDEFKYSFGLKDVLKHTPSLDPEPGKPVHGYAVARLRDGAVQFDVMSHREIEAIRARSRAGKSGPWVTDWEEMAKKTVLRRLSKMLPASVELARAVAIDEQVDANLPQQFETALELDAAPEPAHTDGPPKTLDDLAKQPAPPSNGNGAPADGPPAGHPAGPDGDPPEDKGDAPTPEEIAAAEAAKPQPAKGGKK